MNAQQIEPQTPLAVPVPEAARMLGVGVSTTYRLIGEGKLATCQIGTRRLVRVSSLRKFVGEPA
jgi:excisionase family DNA binding protein